MKIHNVSNTKGASLVELVIASLIFSIFIVGVTTSYISIMRFEHDVRMKGQAINLAREGLEAVYTLYITDWITIGATNETTDYQVQATSGTWELVTIGYDMGDYTRVINFENAFRDADGNISDTGTEDPETKRITVTISWDNLGSPSTFSLTMLLADWKNST